MIFEVREPNLVHGRTKRWNKRASVVGRHVGTLSNLAIYQLDGLCEVVSGEKRARIISGGRMFGFLRHPVMAGIRQRILPLRVKADVVSP